MDETATPSPTPSHETPQDLIEIRQAEAITVAEAKLIADHLAYGIGKSTLQRWAKHWAESGSASPVKCVLVTNRLGVAYRIDKSDFEAWVLEQKENQPSRETLQDPVRHQEASQDFTRPHETLQDPARPRETFADDREARGAKRGGEETNGRLAKLEQENAELRTENMNLKIDLGVRKGLLDRAWMQLSEITVQANNLLRENGALNFRIAQLAAPSDRPQETLPQNAEAAAAHGEGQFVVEPRPETAASDDRPSA